MRVRPSQTQEEPGKCILSRPVAKRLAGSRNQKELCKASKESVVLSEAGEREVSARPRSVFEGHGNTFGFYSISRGNHHRRLKQRSDKKLIEFFNGPFGCCVKEQEWKKGAHVGFLKDSEISICLPNMGVKNKGVLNKSYSHFALLIGRFPYPNWICVYVYSCRCCCCYFVFLYSSLFQCNLYYLLSAEGIMPI